MTATLYPVATTAQAALQEPFGFAERESEARAVAAGAVVFAAEPIGPVFANHAAAQAAYGAGGRGGAALAAGWARLTPVVAEGARAGLRPVKPTYAEGRRWPQSGPAASSHWRLWVSYWRIGEAEAQALPEEAARRLRHKVDSHALAPNTLNALARQPLRAVRPQQPLDIGLFEARRPEAPELIVPDE